MKNNTILLRRTILAQLEAAYPATLSFATILDGLEISGFRLDSTILEKQIAYLQEIGFVNSVCSQICPSFRRVKISAKGIDYLQQGEC